MKNAVKHFEICKKMIISINTCNVHKTRNDPLLKCYEHALHGLEIYKLLLDFLGQCHEVDQSIAVILEIPSHTACGVTRGE